MNREWELSPTATATRMAWPWSKGSKGIRVIEKSAYDALQAEADQLEHALYDLIFSFADSEDVVVARDLLKKLGRWREHEKPHTT